MNDLERMMIATRSASRRHAAPPPPGAQVSPQIPGQTPDRSAVPGYEDQPTPPVTWAVQRMMSQSQTAAGRLELLEPADVELAIADFELGPISEAEARRAYPWQEPPDGPTIDFRLDQGISEIAPGAKVEALPESSS